MSEDTRQYLLMVVLVLIVNIPAAYHGFVIVMHDLRHQLRDSGDGYLVGYPLV